MTLPPRTSRQTKVLADAQAKAALGKAEHDRLREGLPHLFGQKWYSWAKAFFESRNRMNILCAANQITKSSTQMRKWIHWATCPKIWPELWPGRRPVQFWVLYPNKDVATAEWETKIEREFMPRGEFKNHPIYGWTEEWDKKHIASVRFNSGVIIYFKSYEQDVHALQSGTVDAIFCDEELPEDLFSELQARLFSTDGYFHLVFTATRGQLFWLQVVEGEGDNEKLPDAFKLQVSMFDCQYYADGTPGAYPEEKIKRVIAGCKSDAEVLRRVYGKFIKESGRIYHTFAPLRDVVKPFHLPPGLLYYSAIDYGSGGKAHPGAFVFIAVTPDYRKGWVFKGWKGDENHDTTAGDILDKWEMKRIGTPTVLNSYDQGAKDLATIATRRGLPLEKSEKGHDIGEEIVNTLFQCGALKIFDIDELKPLPLELITVMKETPKQKRKDDQSDALRYCAVSIPWDFDFIKAQAQESTSGEKKKSKEDWTPEDQAKWELDQRRGGAPGRERKGAEEVAEDQAWQDFEAEISEWNDLAGNY